MPDRDNYRGYGDPSGRYAENREYERGGGRSRDDRSNWMGGDRDRDRDQDDNRGGFFERAGEEIRSWFGDDDDRGRGRDEYRGQDRGRTYGGGMPRERQSYDRDDRPPQTYGGEPTSGGYDYRRDEWRGRPPSNAGREGGGMFGGAGRSQGRDQGSNLHDEHYSEWRNQQISALDRDYEEYRRENRDKFHSEFSNWRGQREQQRSSMRKVTEHMEVVGSDGQPVGTVDKVSGDKIILTKNDPNAGGHHHSIPCSWIQSVEDKVTINKTAEQAREKWTDEENRRALFESDDQRRDDGPHMLNRSFSGTYDKR